MLLHPSLCSLSISVSRSRGYEGSALCAIDTFALTLCGHRVIPITRPIHRSQLPVQGGPNCRPGLDGVRPRGRRANVTYCGLRTNGPRVARHLAVRVLDIGVSPNAAIGITLNACTRKSAFPMVAQPLNTRAAPLMAEIASRQARRMRALTSRDSDEEARKPTANPGSRSALT